MYIIPKIFRKHIRIPSDHQITPAATASHSRNSAQDARYQCHTEYRSMDRSISAKCSTIYVPRSDETFATRRNPLARNDLPEPSTTK